MNANQPTTPDGRKIVVQKGIYSYWPAFDWVANVEGDEEEGNYGYGTTEDAAVADLLSILEDAA